MRGKDSLALSVDFMALLKKADESHSPFSQIFAVYCYKMLDFIQLFLPI